jgi:hypothetical protein
MEPGNPTPKGPWFGIGPWSTVAAACDFDGNDKYKGVQFLIWSKMRTESRGVLHMPIEIKIFSDYI